MTTLPQTTNVRLPRPVPGQVQLPAAPGVLGGPIAPSQAIQGPDAWRVIRSHIWMILLVVCIISPLAGWGANWVLARYYPRYTATGYVQVQPQIDPTEVARRGAQPQNLDPASTALEIRTHAQELLTDALLTKVLMKESGEIRRTQWFRQFNNDIAKAKIDFEDNLSVTAVQDTKLVRIQFTYSKAEDCKTIVQELVSTYLEEQKKNQTDSLADRTLMLNSIKIKIDTRLRDIGSDLREKQIKLNTDGGSISIGRIGVKEIELSKLVSEQVDAQLQNAKSRSMFESAASAVQQGQDPPGVDRMMNMINPMLPNLQEQLRQLEIERDLLVQQKGEQNPQCIMLAKRCEMFRAQFQTANDEARAKARVAVLESFKQEAEEANSRVQGLQQKVDNLKAELGELANSMMQLLNLQDEQRGLRDQRKLVSDQIENMMALQSSPAASRVTWNTMPVTPRSPSFPKLPVVMAIAIALGLALSLGVAFLREATDQSIRSPRDIARVGQMQFLGIIPEESDDPQAAGARLPVVIFDAPHSHMAESFRHVRTRLQHAASLDTTRSLMVTSPSPGDGKTTVACNLAAGLALNGRRILLVDANFRRPEVHKVFGLANEQGFSDVLNAVAAFDEVIRETQVPNLAVMTAGPRPMNPTELFESQLLIDFIERALEEFDHVIFDGAPIMVVAEAQAMAPRVDGVISVVRAKANNRGLLQRMRDELKRTRAEHLGIVLNAVRAQGGGYYRRNIQTYYDYGSNGHS